MSGGELIHLPNTLAKRIGPRVRVFTATLLRQAEAALARVSDHFEEWLRHDLASLDSVRLDIRAHGMTSAKLRELGRCARQLRGAGDSFGYPIISSFAGHLWEALHRHGATLPVQVLDAYIDAMKAAVRDRVRDAGDPTASEIVAALEAKLRASPVG